MINKTFIIILTLSLVFTFVSASDPLYCNPNLPGGQNCIAPTSTSISFNNNTGSVNNSQYWQGYTPQTYNTTFISWIPSWITDNFYPRNLNPNGYYNISTLPSPNSSYDTNPLWLRNGTAIYNNNSGNIGIGTINPLRTLHLHSTASTYQHFSNTNTGVTASDGSDIGIDATQSDSFIIWNRENSAVRMATSGAERMRIDSSGNVGVGTINPTTLLHLNGSSSALMTSQTSGGRVMTFGASDSAPYTHVGTTSSNTFNLITNNVIRAEISAGGGMIIGGSGYTGAGISAPTNGLLVQGNVGINKTVPVFNLDVNGIFGVTANAYTTGASYNFMYFNSSEKSFGTAQRTNLYNAGAVNAYTVRDSTSNIAMLNNQMEYQQSNVSEVTRSVTGVSNSITCRAETNASGTQANLSSCTAFENTVQGSSTGRVVNLASTSSKLSISDGQVWTNVKLNQITGYLWNGNITNYYGFYIDNSVPNIGTTGNLLGSMYGIYVHPLNNSKTSAGSGGTPYSLYLVGTEDRNYIGGTLGIASSPLANTQVVIGAKNQNFTNLNLRVASNPLVDSFVIQNSSGYNFTRIDKDGIIYSRGENILGNLNQTSGNATINNIYGEIYNKSDTGFFTIDLVNVDTYYPVDNLTAGSINGFTQNSYNLTAQYGGMYKATAKFGMISAGAGGDNGMKIFVNEVGQNQCYDHEHTSSTAPIGFIIDCFVRLNTGDNVSVRFDDHQAPVSDLTALNGNLNLVRIGN